MRGTKVISKQRNERCSLGTKEVIERHRLTGTRLRAENDRRRRLRRGRCQLRKDATNEPILKNIGGEGVVG